MGSGEQKTLRRRNMKSIVITGGTRGIGLGLARGFLERSCFVTISGKTQESVERVLHELAPFNGKMQAVVADVRKRGDMELLLETAVTSFGTLDIWVNNAGITHEDRKVWELDENTVEDVLDSNVLGVIHGTVVPFLAMREQGGGKIYNMEGLGSDGFIIDGMSIYGTTKSALRYFTRAFANEAKDSPVLIGSLSPGMVVTDLLRETVGDDSAESRKKRKFYNMMADDVETVTEFLCEKMLTGSGGSQRIQWLTKPKIFFRMLTAPFRKRDLFK